MEVLLKFRLHVEFLKVHIYTLVNFVQGEVHIYRPQRSWAKVISLQACVCPRGGGGTWPGPGGLSEILGGGLKFSRGV